MIRCFAHQSIIFVTEVGGEPARPETNTQRAISLVNCMVRRCSGACSLRVCESWMLALASSCFVGSRCAVTVPAWPVCARLPADAAPLRTQPHFAHRLASLYFRCLALASCCFEQCAIFIVAIIIGNVEHLIASMNHSEEEERHKVCAFDDCIALCSLSCCCC